MNKFILKEKSFMFAVDIIKFCREMQRQKEFILSKQLLRSGTAVGALIREAEFGESRADFTHKLSIALKEANESYYWLSLANDACPDLKTSDLPKLQSLCKELIAMLVAIVKRMKST